jgi:hypothetical protein
VTRLAGPTICSSSYLPVTRELRQKDIVVTIRLIARTTLSIGMRSLKCHLVRMVVSFKSFLLRRSRWQIQFGLVLRKSIQIDVRF